MKEGEEFWDNNRIHISGWVIVKIARSHHKLLLIDWQFFSLILYVEFVFSSVLLYLFVGNRAFILRHIIISHDGSIVFDKVEVVLFLFLIPGHNLVWTVSRLILINKSSKIKLFELLFIVIVIHGLLLHILSCIQTHKSRGSMLILARTFLLIVYLTVWSWLR